jgi:hypothetical protein
MWREAKNYLPPTESVQVENGIVAQRIGDSAMGAKFGLLSWFAYTPAQPQEAKFGGTSLQNDVSPLFSLVGGE